MFRQQSIADPPAGEDVFRVPTFISTGPVSAFVRAKAETTVIHCRIQLFIGNVILESQPCVAPGNDRCLKQAWSARVKASFHTYLFIMSIKLSFHISISKEGFIYIYSHMLLTEIKAHLQGKMTISSLLWLK